MIVLPDKIYVNSAECDVKKIIAIADLAVYYNPSFPPV